MISKVYAEGKVDIGSQFGFGNIKTLGKGLSMIVPLAFAVAAVLVVFYFLIGAFELITSQGDKNEVASARAKITHAIIGFVILIFVFLVLEALPRVLFGEGTTFRIIDSDTFNIEQPGGPK